jgi:hypothetical protein
MFSMICASPLLCLSTEADFALLRGEDDAHFGAEIVVEKIWNHIPAMNRKFHGSVWRRFMASS